MRYGTIFSSDAISRNSSGYILSVFRSFLLITSDIFSEQERTMRAFQVGPGSSRSNWTAKLDPGKSLPCSNSGGQRPADASNQSGQQNNQQGSGQNK